MDVHVFSLYITLVFVMLGCNTCGSFSKTQHPQHTTATLFLFSLALLFTNESLYRSEIFPFVDARRDDDGGQYVRCGRHLPIHRCGSGQQGYLRLLLHTGCTGRLENQADKIKAEDGKPGVTKFKLPRSLTLTLGRPEKHRCPLPS